MPTCNYLSSTSRRASGRRRSLFCDLLAVVVICGSCLWPSASLDLQPSARGSQFALVTPGAINAEDWLTSHAPREQQPLPAKEYLQRNAEFAVRARTKFGYAKVVPESMFLTWVLPYRHFDEPVDDWREIFYNKLSPFVANASTLQQAAEAVIPHIWQDLGSKVEFKPEQTPRLMAPVSETLHVGYASCTGLSILLADGLRAVGIPARVAGTPQWNLKTGGNHNWVEVWLGDDWHFIDAVPGQEGMWDNTWFADGNVQKAVPDGGMHGIYVPIWDSTQANSSYALTWRNSSPRLPAVDRTNFYKALPTKAGTACGGSCDAQHSGVQKVASPAWMTLAYLATAMWACVSLNKQ